MTYGKTLERTTTVKMSARNFFILDPSFGEVSGFLDTHLPQTVQKTHVVFLY
ncbi:hypothetical protein ACMTAS_0587 [Thermotoga neapolitana DSM 4359]